MANSKLTSLKRRTIGYTRKDHKNLSGMLLVLALCISVMIICGCDQSTTVIPPNVHNVSDLDGPIIRSKVFDAAILESDLQVQLSPSGEKVYYAPNQDQPYTGWVKNIRQLQQFQAGKRHGIFVKWYGNWETVVQGQYKNGNKDGVWIQWSPIGQKESEGTYKNGRREGMWIIWQPDGKKEIEIKYQNGMVLSYETMTKNVEANSESQKDSDSHVPLAFIFHNSSEANSRSSLPNSAILRMGKGKVNDFHYSPDDSRLFLATTQGIWIYDISNGKELAFPGDTGYVKKIIFSPDGNTFVTIGKDSSIRFWDSGSGVQKKLPEVNYVYGDKVYFSPDGRMFACMNQNRRISLWNLAGLTHFLLKSP